MKRPGGFDAGSPADPPTGEERSPRPPIALPEFRLPRKRSNAPLPESDEHLGDTDPDTALTVPLDEAVAELSSRGDADASGGEPPATGIPPAGVPESGILEFDAPHGEVQLAERPADVREAKRRLRDAEKSRRQRERGEQRRFTAHLRRRRRVWIIVGSAIVGLALFVAVGVFTPVMAVREVQIVGASHMNTDDLQTAMSRFEGVPLALVNDQEVHDALLPFPLIERYAIERVPPQTLVLVIEERDAVLAIEVDGALALYDAAGVLVGNAAERPEGVPLAAGAVLDTASPAFQAAGTVIRDLPADVRAAVAGVEAASPEELTFTLTSGSRVVWGGVEQTQRKAVVLRSMLASLGPVSVIDVSAPDTPVFV